MQEIKKDQVKEPSRKQLNVEITEASHNQLILIKMKSKKPFYKIIEDLIDLEYFRLFKAR